MRIFIVGLKSSGKTTLGRELAKRMHMDFIDLDERLEQKFGMTIPELYLSEGEESFRKKETEMLAEISPSDNIVVSTGGGAACYSDNMDLMNAWGITVYLKADESTLAERLLRVAHERPVVKGRTKEEIVEFVRELRSKCEPFYMKARHIIDEKEFSARQLIKKLQE